MAIGLKPILFSVVSEASPVMLHPASIPRLSYIQRPRLLSNVGYLMSTQTHLLLAPSTRVFCWDSPLFPQPCGRLALTPASLSHIRLRGLQRQVELVSVMHHPSQGQPSVLNEARKLGP